MTTRDAACHCGQLHLEVNTACRESLAAQTADAIAHLTRAIEVWEGCRELARGDTDIDPIRGEPAFAGLVDS